VTDGMRDEEKIPKCLAFDRQAMADLVKQNPVCVGDGFDVEGWQLGLKKFFSQIHRYLGVN